MRRRTISTHTPSRASARLAARQEPPAGRCFSRIMHSPLWRPSRLALKPFRLEPVHEPPRAHAPRPSGTSPWTARCRPLRVRLVEELQAGGTGLHLTAADFVIHLEPWWNPVVEDQSSDRTCRIGQTRLVMICRLVAGDTIERQILRPPSERLTDRSPVPPRARFSEDATALSRVSSPKINTLSNCANQKMHINYTNSYFDIARKKRIQGALHEKQCLRRKIS